MPIVPSSRASGGADHRGLHIHLIEYVCGFGAPSAARPHGARACPPASLASPAVADRHGRLSDLIFRLAFAPIFVVGGLLHFMVRGPGGYALMPGRG